MRSRAVLPIVRAKFDSAQTTPDNRRHWANADGLAPNAAVNPEVRRVLRNRARYEVANNSYAKGIVLTLANDAIGTGPRLQMLTPSAEANRLIEDAFEFWSQAVDLAGKLRTMRMARAESGEAFAILTSNPVVASPVKLDLKLIEPDQVTSPRARVPRPSEVDGIIFDAFGNPVAYHVLKRHPGDGMFWRDNDPLAFDAVPAASVIHYFRPDRPGQWRGIPDITPALPLFAQLRRYTLAVIAAAETAADFAAVLYSDAPAHGEAEPLEPRRLLATFTVNTAADSGTGSLRQAIEDSNLVAGADAILFDGSLNGHTITLGGTELFISDDLTIKGPGARLLTVSANSQSRVFSVSLATVSISGLAITGGVANGDGGGILSYASTLTVWGVRVRGNVASAEGAGIANHSGTLVVRNSELSANTANAGGGIYNNDHGTLVVTNSTISGNTAYGPGGILNTNGTLSIANSTIAGNSGGIVAGGLWNQGPGAVMRSTIVSGNTGGDISGDPLASGSINNLVSDAGSAGGLIHGVGGNLVGVDPKLAPLAENGGATRTHALLAGSPATDRGVNPLGLTTDQRGQGFPRVRGAAIDMGAFESIPAADLLGVALDAAPESIAAGSKIAGLDYQVKNQGGTGVVDTFVVRFYLSTDASFTASDYLLGGRTIDADFAAGQTRGLSADNVFTLPQAGGWSGYHGNGTYYIGMIVDYFNVIPESNEGNNRNRGDQLDWDAITITGLPKADLLGTQFDIAPESFTAGSKLTSLDYQVKNQGGTGVIDTFVVRFYLSTDASFTASDYFLGGRTIDAGFAAGQTRALSADNVFTLPQAGGWSGYHGNGTYYIGMIVDYFNVIPESNEGNNRNRGDQLDWDAVTINVPPAPGRADLVGSYFHVEDAPAFAGGSLPRVRFEVRNQGGGDVVDAFVVSIYLSVDGDIGSADDFRIGSVAQTAPLCAGQSLRLLVSDALVMPRFAEWDGYRGGGARFLGIVVDPLDEVGEANESNNRNRGEGLDFSGVTLAPRDALDVGDFAMNMTARGRSVESRARHRQPGSYLLAEHQASTFQVTLLSPDVSVGGRPSAAISAPVKAKLVDACAQRQSWCMRDAFPKRTLDHGVAAAFDATVAVVSGPYLSGYPSQCAPSAVSYPFRLAAMPEGMESRMLGGLGGQV